MRRCVICVLAFSAASHSGPMGGRVGCYTATYLSVKTQCTRVGGQGRQVLVFANGHALNNWCVCSAAQTCTLSVENLKFDSATCGVTKYIKTSADAKLGVGQKCNYVCATGASSKETEMQCKAEADKTKAEGTWDAGCAGARFYFGVGWAGRNL